MHFTYDGPTDVLDIDVLDNALVSRTEQIDGGTLVDLDADGRVVAIEIIHPARRWPLEEILGRFAIAEADADVLRSLWREPRTYPFAEPTEVGAGSDAGELVVTA